MHKRLPNISIEKYAAYLDGNLTDEEMQQIESFIEKDSDMQAFLEADDRIEAVSEMNLFDNEPVSSDIELASIELPSFDEGLPMEPNTIVNDFFSMDGDRFGEEMGSIMNDDVNHHEFMDGTSYMNGSFEIEDNPIGLTASEHEGGLANDTPYDWGIHDGDYGFLELGLPPVLNESDVLGSTGTPDVYDNADNMDNWADSRDIDDY